MKIDYINIFLLTATVVLCILAFKAGMYLGGIKTCEGSGGELIEYEDGLRCGNITITYIEQEYDALGRFKAQYVREGIP